MSTVQFKITILSEDFHWDSFRLSIGEHGADLLSLHDLLDGVVLHPVANDGRGAVIQRPLGRQNLRLHSAGANRGLLPELDGGEVPRVERMEDPGVFLVWRAIVYTVDIGHEDGEVGSDLHGHASGQAVVVLDVQGAVIAFKFI